MKKIIPLLRRFLRPVLFVAVVPLVFLMGMVCLVLLWSYRNDRQD